MPEYSPTLSDTFMWAHEGASSKPGGSSSQSLCHYQRVFPTPGTESPRRGCGDGFSLCHPDDVGAGLDDSEVESVTCLGRMPKVKVDKWQKVLDQYIEITLQTIIINHSHWDIFRNDRIDKNCRCQLGDKPRVAVRWLCSRHGWWFRLDFHWQHLLKALLKLLDCGWSFTCLPCFCWILMSFADHVCFQQSAGW